MKYAVVDDQRIEALPKGRALCPVCRSAVIAKCGTRRIHHWAHRGLENCDSWKEPETEWHRAWKNKFPLEWQEFIQHDQQSGEKHIADVRTQHGLVIEFQHSHLDPKERLARERFYKKMYWVVDGTRLKRDFPRFLKGLASFKPADRKGHFLVSNPDKYFPVTWLDCSVSVFFDFLGGGAVSPSDQIRGPLWCLLPRRVGDGAEGAMILRDRFVEAIKNGPRAPQAPAPGVVNQTQPLGPRVVVDPGLLRQLDPQLYRDLTRIPPRRSFRRL